MRVFFETNQNPAHNLAVEEYLLYHTNEDVLMLWQNDKSIIIGRNQNTAAEINRTFVTEEKIPVVRRLSGGGAVFHDLGNLNYTFIRRGAKDSFNDYASFAQPVLQVLQDLGVPATLSGRNDLLVEGKKFSGNAQVAFGDSVLHHGTLLFSADMGMLTKALTVHPLKVQSKGISSVRSRVGNLSDYTDCTPLQFADLLMAQFLGDDSPRPLTDTEEAQVWEIQKKRYDTWEWNFGSNTPYSIQNTAYFTAGLLTAQLNVSDNRISALHFSGDFFGRRDIAQLESALLGTLYEEESLKKCLASLDLGEYIAGITAEELLSILL